LEENNTCWLCKKAILVSCLSAKQQATFSFNSKIEALSTGAVLAVLPRMGVGGTFFILPSFSSLPAR
jgi:hypothetical protein